MPKSKTAGSSLVSQLKNLKRRPNGAPTFVENIADTKKRAEFIEAIKYLSSLPSRDRPALPTIIEAMRSELGFAPSSGTLSKLLRDGCE